MRRGREPANIGNSSYQRQVAVSLVQTLGRECAIDDCIQHGWDGTLNIILNDKRHAVEVASALSGREPSL